MNPVSKQISKGLVKWSKIAHVSNLSKKYKLPRIIFGSQKRAIIISTGLHLEETSGPLTLLDPAKLKWLLEFAKKNKFTIVLYPIINNRGLSYLPTADEKFLRTNDKGVDYNDCWGIKEVTGEVRIVSRDIKKIIKKYDVVCALSLHEDSALPKKGYIWTNGVAKKLREQICKLIKSNILKKYILEIGQKTFEGGKVENRFCVVNARDYGSFEVWMAELNNIPTVLSEAPFGEKLAIRSKFHMEVIKATLICYTTPFVSYF